MRKRKGRKEKKRKWARLEKVNQSDYKAGL